MAMLKALEELNEDFAEKGWPEIRIGVGVNTGVVRVGNMGSEYRMSYTAIGDAVNVAQRVESSATPGSVFIPESTRRLVAPYFEIVPAGMFELKGKPHPVPLFEVVADRGITRTVRGVEGLAASVVGRTVEQAALCGGAIHDAILIPPLRRLALDGSPL